MEQRFNMQELEPQAYKAMLQISAYVAQTRLSPLQLELIKIRASQLNQCAHCLDMHTRDAIKKGETPQRIFLLNAWRETTLFSPEEKALLALTESVTLISREAVPDPVFQEARKYFDENQVAQAVMAIIVINAWNRIAISSQLQVKA